MAMTKRLRREIAENEAGSARYFKGQGGNIMHCEQDKTGVFNTYLPWSASGRYCQ
jgi:hypothetical protein